jgi:hypothetical protein
MLAALGHDIYLLYTDPNKSFELINFEFSDLGFLWTKYHPESYSSFIEQLDPAAWEKVNKFLTFEAFYIGLAFAVFGYVILGIAKIITLSKGAENSMRDVKKKWKTK